MLDRHGYSTKKDRIYLQCFDYAEVRRIRSELGYRGRLIQLLDDGEMDGAGTDYDRLRTRAGLEELALVADGIGPSIETVVTGRRPGEYVISDLVRLAHDLGLEVHPYTLRADELPGYVQSLEDLLRILLLDAGVDGLFTDYPDRGSAFVRSMKSVR